MQWSTIIEKGLKHVDEIWGVETQLYFRLYRTTDLVGIYKGQPAVMDFKQTQKPKKEWVEDYFYNLLHISQHTTKYMAQILKQGHISMCSRDEQYPSI